MKITPSVKLKGSILIFKNKLLRKSRHNLFLNNWKQAEIQKVKKPKAGVCEPFSGKI